MASVKPLKIGSTNNPATFSSTDTIDDGFLTIPYVKTDGTRPLTGNWNMGAFSAESKQTASAANVTFNGFLLTNTTTASAANQMYSPAVVFTGQGWKTTATAASQSVVFQMFNQPVQGAANPTGNLLIQSNINGAGFNTRFTLTDAGALTISNQFTCSSVVSVGAISATNGVITGTRLNIATTSSDGLVANNTTAATSGVQQQYSGRIRTSGTAWTGAASQTADFAFENRPINGTSPITANWVLMSQINGAGYNDRLTVADNGNFGFNTTNFGNGVKVLGIGNATAPSGTPTGGGILYVEAGVLKYKGSSGTVTTIANA